MLFDAAQYGLDRVMKGVGRRVKDITQKALGRTAIRYEFELMPLFVGEYLASVADTFWQLYPSEVCFIHTMHMSHVTCASARFAACRPDCEDAWSYALATDTQCLKG